MMTSKVSYSANCQKLCQELLTDLCHFWLILQLEPLRRFVGFQVGLQMAGFGQGAISLYFCSPVRN